eukprot:4879588-Alexandrium_andersonii.AAC.1
MADRAASQIGWPRLPPIRKSSTCVATMPITAGCFGLRFCMAASSASCRAFGTSSSVTFSASRTQMH